MQLLASCVTLNKSFKLSEAQFLQMLRHGMIFIYPNFLKGCCEAEKKIPKITVLKNMNVVPMLGIIL